MLGVEDEVNITQGPHWIPDQKLDVVEQEASVAKTAVAAEQQARQLQHKAWQLLEEEPPPTRDAASSAAAIHAATEAVVAVAD